MDARIVNEKVAEHAPAAAGETALCEAAELGQRIVRLRELRGWQQAELAQRLGVTRSRLGNWERGFHTPPLAALLVLRRELGVSLDELVTGEPVPLAGLGGGQKAEARKRIAELMRLLGLSRDAKEEAARKEGRL